MITLPSPDTIFQSILKLDMWPGTSRGWDLMILLKLYFVFLKSCMILTLLDFCKSMMFKNTENQWQCCQCNYISNNVSHAQTHVEAKHIITKSFSCPVCAKLCPVKNSLMIYHFLDHEILGLIDKDYCGAWQCQCCDYSTRIKQGMINHIESKHVDSGGATCQLCGRNCPTRYALQIHGIRQHTLNCF